MDGSDLKQNIEALAKAESKTELEIITELQAAAVLTDDEKLLNELCDLKWDYI